MCSRCLFIVSSKLGTRLGLGQEVGGGDRLSPLRFREESAVGNGTGGLVRPASKRPHWREKVTSYGNLAGRLAGST